MTLCVYTPRGARLAPILYTYTMYVHHIYIRALATRKMRCCAFALVCRTLARENI